MASGFSTSGLAAADPPQGGVIGLDRRLQWQIASQPLQAGVFRYDPTEAPVSPIARHHAPNETEIRHIGGVHAGPWDALLRNRVPRTTVLAWLEGCVDALAWAHPRLGRA